MIVIGYQGIGKTTLANTSMEYIDLESSNFFVNGERADDWYVPYCNIAESLSKHEYVVFVSSHEVVRERLKNSNEKVVCCVPSKDLKDKWIKKLEDRYNETQLEKDYKAYMNAKERYEENIDEIENSGFPVIRIRNMNYDLESLLYEWS